MSVSFEDWWFHVGLPKFRNVNNGTSKKAAKEVWEAAQSAHLMYLPKAKTSRVPIPVEIFGLQEHTPLCRIADSQCPYTKECAQHYTAGDFRSEDGMTPDLELQNGVWHCSKTRRENNGMLFVENGKLTHAALD
jgi:hypothetical protein